MKISNWLARRRSPNTSCSSTKISLKKGRKNGDRLLQIARHACALTELKRCASRRDDARRLRRLSGSATHRRGIGKQPTRQSSRRESAALFERAEHAPRGPQPRVRLLRAFGIPDAPHASRVAPARCFRSSGWRSRDTPVAMVRRRQLRMSPRRREQHFAHRKDRALRTRLHSRSREASPLCRGISDHDVHAPAHHHDAAPSTETERLRRSRAAARYPRRRTNRERELRADAEIQLLEHLHRPARPPLQRKPHPLRGFRQLPRQFFLMRQNDRADLDEMAADIGLTELTKHAILVLIDLAADRAANSPRSRICTTTHRIQSAAPHTMSPRPKCSTSAAAVVPSLMSVHYPSGRQHRRRRGNQFRCQEAIALIARTRPAVLRRWDSARRTLLGSQLNNVKAIRTVRCGRRVMAHVNAVHFALRAGEAMCYPNPRSSPSQNTRGLFRVGSHEPAQKNGFLRHRLDPKRIFSTVSAARTWLYGGLQTITSNRPFTASNTSESENAAFIIARLEALCRAFSTARGFTSTP